MIHLHRCIPEFVVENTIGFLCFLRRLSPNTFEEQGPSFLNPILTEVSRGRTKCTLIAIVKVICGFLQIIILMESQHRLYNPHLRARLAESLEALLPIADENGTPATPNMGTFHREQLFLTHPDRQQVSKILLRVIIKRCMHG